MVKSLSSIIYLLLLIMNEIINNNNSIKENNKTIIFDYFIRQSNLYLISTYWSIKHHYISEGLPKLDITVNNNKLEEVGYDESEPLRFFTYKLNSKIKLPLSLKINNNDYLIMPEKIKPLKKKHKFAVATLFKIETSEWIERFVNYYKKQGVDAFYFYYNGPLKEMPSNLPQDKSIFYIIWDYPYWLENIKLKHYAQTTFLMDFRLKYYDDNEFVAMIDLDEYIYNSLDSKTIYECIKDLNKDIIVVANHWATVSGKQLKYNINSSGWDKRTKVIYNTKYRGYYGIHWIKPKKSINDQLVKSIYLKMLHVIDVLHPNRIEKMEKYTRVTKEII